MNTQSETKPWFKHPSAWMPIAISLTALGFLLLYAAFVGTGSSPSGDERAPARFFQFLMAVQLPIAAYFAVTQMPKRPKQTLLILAIQAAVWIVPILTVIWLEGQ